MPRDAEPNVGPGQASQAPKQRVQDAIRRDIITGRLPAGTRITEASLASDHGISRVPVREALHALEAEGFVESRPFAGSTVCQIPLDDADDLFAVREALEAAIARRAAQRAAAQFAAGEPGEGWFRIRRELAHVLDKGDDALAAGRPEELPELNIRFHLAIAELGGSNSLQVLLRQISGKIEWLYAAGIGSRGPQAWAEHRAILAAIDAGDAAGAKTLMAAHVDKSRKGYMSRFGA